MKEGERGSARTDDDGDGDFGFWGKGVAADLVGARGRSVIRLYLY